MDNYTNNLLKKLFKEKCIVVPKGDWIPLCRQLINLFDIEFKIIPYGNVGVYIKIEEVKN